MQRLIVGTAGHIDHGKTSLIEALTGVDCDRFTEEKQRGITIDLGFAHLGNESVQIGFIDVPGHEKFLHNALAGLGGIGAMLLVVAADEGVKPQTLEHLGICSLLGIPRAVVALTKCDLVDEDLLELARLELADLLAPTPFSEAPILPVSSKTGAGIPELKQVLFSLIQDRPLDNFPGEAMPSAPSDAGFAAIAQEQPARLPVDRAFHMKGMGTVVTGTLVAGTLKAGDLLALEPGNTQARVRAVQVHGDTREQATAGERTAVQLAQISGSPPLRGQELIQPQTYSVSDRLLVEAYLLPKIDLDFNGWTPIRTHLFAGQTLGRLRVVDGSLSSEHPALVEIRLAGPVVCCRGDRVILRRPSPPLTLGGGRIVDPNWKTLPMNRRQRAFKAVESDQAMVAFWAEERGERGLSKDELGRRLGIGVVRSELLLKELVDQQELLSVPASGSAQNRWIRPSAFAALSERSHQLLTSYFKDHRLSTGMPKAEWVDQLFRPGCEDLVATYADWLEKQGKLVLSHKLVDLPGRTAVLEERESEAAGQLLDIYEQWGLTPPSPEEVARSVGGQARVARGVIQYLVERKKLTTLPGGLIVSQVAIDKMVDELRATGWERFTVSEFKTRFELSRKWAIPLLESLDSSGVTRRQGSERLLVAN